MYERNGSNLFIMSRFTRHLTVFLFFLALGAAVALGLHFFPTKTTASPQIDSTLTTVAYFRLFNDALKLEKSSDLTILLEYSEDTDTDKWMSNEIEYSDLTKQDATFTAQSSDGILYEPKVHVTFRLQRANITGINYRFKIFRKIGLFFSKLYAPIPGFSPEESSGYRNVTVIDKSFNIHGKLRVEFLIAKPLFVPDTVGAADTYSDVSQLHWTGHRGIGTNIRTDLTPPIYENTIDAFTYVCQHGAHGVELDVQLSRDLIPVIYHDFTARFQMQTKNQSSIPVMGAIKDYTVAELQSLRVAGLEEFKLFETFQDVLEQMPAGCGINVEIKYPQQYRNLEMEAALPVDINLFVDKILGVLLKYAGDRPIFLSSFSADICVLTHHKQTRFYTYFLTSGDLLDFPSPPWDVYYDPRTVSVTANIAFAKSLNLRGLSLYSDHLYNVRMDDIERIHAHNLQLAVWGASVDTRSKADQLLQRGVNILILDHVDQILASRSSDLSNKSTSVDSAALNVAPIAAPTSTADN